MPSVGPRLIMILVSLLVGGCTANEGGSDGNDPADGNDASGVPPITQGNWYRPTVDTTWQWQLQPDRNGQVNTTYQVGLYDIDLFNTPIETIDQLHSAGHKVIGYFSAGTYEGFRPDSGEFQPAELGSVLEDFTDERWLDVRSTNVRSIMIARLDLAAQKGFDGVEPDNVDGFANDSGFDLTAADQLAFNRWIANEAHQRGLSVGLKNDLDQISALVEYFDFAVNEQCHEYSECGLLQPFVDAGKPVLNAEYASQFSNSASARNSLCNDAQSRDFRTLVLPLDLDDSFRFTCDP